MTDKNTEWVNGWLDSVASGEATMSQRKASSIDSHGGLEAAVATARRKGIHLVLLTDDKDEVLVAASRKPFKTLC